MGIYDSIESWAVFLPVNHRRSLRLQRINMQGPLKCGRIEDQQKN